MIAGGDGTENKRRVFRRRAQEHPPLHCILDLYSQDNWRQSRRDVKGMTSRVEQLQLRKKWRTMFDLNETPVIRWCTLQVLMAKPDAQIQTMSFTMRVTKARSAMNFTHCAKSWSSKEGSMNGGIANLRTSEPDLPTKRCPGSVPRVPAQWCNNFL